jgi:hypothetical protein
MGGGWAPGVEENNYFLPVLVRWFAALVRYPRLHPFYYYHDKSRYSSGFQSIPVTPLGLEPRTY